MEFTQEKNNVGLDGVDCRRDQGKMAGDYRSAAAQRSRVGRLRNQVVWRGCWVVCGIFGSGDPASAATTRATRGSVSSDGEGNGEADGGRTERKGGPR
jgi:hypothetical protein